MSIIYKIKVFYNNPFIYDMDMIRRMYTCTLQNT